MPLQRLLHLRRRSPRLRARLLRHGDDRATATHLTAKAKRTATVDAGEAIGDPLSGLYPTGEAGTSPVRNRPASLPAPATSVRDTLPRLTMPELNLILL